MPKEIDMKMPWTENITDLVLNSPVSTLKQAGFYSVEFTSDRILVQGSRGKCDIPDAEFSQYCLRRVDKETGMKFFTHVSGAVEITIVDWRVKQ